MKLQSVLFFYLSTAPGFAQEACDTACQTAFQQVLRTESASWVSKDVTNEAFHSTPSKITGAKPGDLLRWEDLGRGIVNTNYAPPAGMSISRFLYIAEDIDRKPIPASAFALLPYNKPDPNRPFTTVVWTHRTAGWVQNCAPSNHKDLYYEWRGPYALATAGYAVIGPDYAGQGSDMPQGFAHEAGFLHAADAAYGLIAARKAIGDLLSKEWVVIGHSEGGMSAWRTNERLAMPGQDDLLKIGTAAISPALRPLDLIPESIQWANGGPVGNSVAIYILQSLASLFSNDIRLEDYLTDTALGRIPLANQGCVQTGQALFANLTGDELFKDLSWFEHPVVVDWQERYNGAGLHPLASPMLVVQGIDDPFVYVNNTVWDFNHTCQGYPESTASLWLYPEVDHFGASQALQHDYLQWIKDRFDHVALPKGCNTKAAQPTTDRFRDFVALYTVVNSWR